MSINSALNNPWQRVCKILNIFAFLIFSVVCGCSASAQMRSCRGQQYSLKTEGSGFMCRPF